MMTIRLDQQPAQQLQRLTSSAVLGLDRSRPVNTNSQAHWPVAFLQELSILSVYVQMGKTCPPADPPGIDVFDQQEKTCSPRAALQLSEILHGQYQGLLLEWCQLAHQQQLKAPCEYLPDLLEHAGQLSVKERSLIQSVLGKRGLWLAGQNPSWKPLLIPEQLDDTVWQTGTCRQRADYFCGVRAVNPAKARQLAEEIWPQEAPDSKLLFIELFRIGLSMDDEPFLEQCLDDKRKPVRQTAAVLLSCLPESQLCKRMTERFWKLVAYQPGKKGVLLSKKPTLEIELPEITDPPLLRDGADPRKAGTLGQKAVALANIIASVPLNAWQALDRNMDALFSTILSSEFSAAVCLGLSIAAVRQQNQPWAQALIRNYPSVKEKLIAAGHLSLDLEGLMGVLSPEKRETVIMEFADRHPGTKHLGVLYEFLLTCPHAWSGHFSKIALKVLQQHFTNNPGSYHLRRPMTELFSLRLSPDIAEQAEQGWPVKSTQFTSGDEEMVQKFTSILRFRQSMIKELSREF
jgi:hypothetical protein